MTRDQIIESGRRVLELEEKALQSVRSRLSGSFASAVNLIDGYVSNGGKVVLAGTGKSGNICSKIAATLSSTGTPALVLNTLDALHGDIGIVQEKDVLILVSYSGETEELVKLMSVISRMGNQMVALCGRPESTLARYSAAAIEVTVEREACPLGLAPTSSSTCMLAVGDALAMVLMELRGFGEGDFARLHPSGALGARLLLRANEMMRSPERTVITQRDRLVSEVLQETAQCKTGAAIIASPEGKLEGFFSYGDLVRALPGNMNSGAIFERKVEEFMTENPISVHAECLAVKVLDILRDHQIDELVVVDDAGIVQGMIDSQDLVRFKLV